MRVNWHTSYRPKQWSGKRESRLKEVNIGVPALETETVYIQAAARSLPIFATVNLQAYCNCVWQYCTCESPRNAASEMKPQGCLPVFGKDTKYCRLFTFQSPGPSFHGLLPCRLTDCTLGATGYFKARSLGCSVYLSPWTVESQSFKDQ